jgi:flagellar basal-body rod protein FlgC
MPNVNPAEQMVDMVSASRAYQMNVEMMNVTRQLMLKTLDLGK